MGGGLPTVVNKSSSHCLSQVSILAEARRTLELSAELSVSRDCWRKLFPQVCGVIFCDFRHACHPSMVPSASDIQHVE